MEATQYKTQNDKYYFEMVFQKIKSLYSSQGFRDNLYEWFNDDEMYNPGLDNTPENGMIDKNTSYHFSIDSFCFKIKEVNQNIATVGVTSNSDNICFDFEDQFFPFILEKLQRDIFSDEKIDPKNSELIDFVTTFRNMNVLRSNVFAELMELRKGECLEVIAHLTPEQAQSFLDGRLAELTRTYLGT
jgi:hypothetical protein